MVCVNHIYCRQIARFHCVRLSHRGCLIWVKFVKIPKQKFERQLSYFSDKARCFSQSECALCGNFIIMTNKRGLNINESRFEYLCDVLLNSMFSAPRQIVCGRVASLIGVGSHMNGWILFKAAIEQTTEKMSLALKQ